MVTFNENDMVVSTVQGNYLEGEEEMDAEVESINSERSGSDYVGAGDDLPEWMWFGSKECRCIFSLEKDKKAFQRVCGNEGQFCSRLGHRVGGKAGEGYYQPVKARKYVDGKLETLMSKEAYESMVKKRRASNEKALASAGQYLMVDVGDTKPAAVPTTGEGGAALVVSGGDTVGSLTVSEAPNSWMEGSGESPSSTSSNPKKRARESDTSSINELIRTLTLSMANLNNQMTKMDLNQQEGNNLLRKAMSKGDRKEDSSGCYAVARGRDGVQGIFNTLGEVTPLVVGVPNNAHMKCKTRQEAQEYIDDFNLNQGLQSAERAIKRWYVVTNSATGECGIYRTWAEASTLTTGVSCATCKKFRRLGDAEEYLAVFKAEFASEQETSESEGEDIERLRGGGMRSNQEPSLRGQWSDYPPSILLGHDSSGGKEDEIFGVELCQGEGDLRKKFTPPALADDQKKGLINNTVDVVSLPGMYNSVGDGDQDAASEMTLLGEAMEELVNQRRVGGENAGRADLHWRSDRRVSLLNIKTMTDLRKRVQVLGKLMPKIRKRMVQICSNACRQGGMRDETVIHAWSNYGWLTVIVTQTFLFYMGLHHHLLTGGEIHGWDYVQAEQEYYAEELRMLRSTSDSRLHCICSSYTLLRDGYKNNWFHAAIQQERNAIMYHPSPVGSSSLQGSASIPEPPNYGLCPKCGTNIHGPDPDTCPWKNQTDERARKNAANALRSMGKGKDGKKDGNKD